jgi:WD40 repeat protein
MSEGAAGADGGSTGTGTLAARASSSSSSYLASGAEDGLVIVWDMKTSRKVHTFAGYVAVPSLAAKPP